MYQTSSDYKELVYADSTQHLLKIYIEGTQVNPSHILSFEISQPLFTNDEFTFGGVIARTINFKIYKDSLPNTYENIYVETGVKIGENEEIVPIGYFTLDEIKKEDDYTVSITAIDYMVKFNFNYDGSTLTYPATMLEVLEDICSQADVELGSDSFLNDNKQTSVYDNTVSAREYVSYIAEQAGGFAFIGRDGKLYIKNIGENVINFNKTFFQKYSFGEQFIVSRIAYEDGVQDYKYGDDTNNTIWINQTNMYIVDGAQVENIYNLYRNFNCYSFEGDTIIDPSYDIGDIIIVDGKKIIYQGTLNYLGKFKANIKSNIQAKTKEQTMTTISTANKIRRVESSINQFRGEIEQLVEEVDENSEKISDTLQTVDEVLTTVQEYVNLTVTVNGLKTITITDAISGSLYGLRIIGNNTVFKGLYFDDDWYFDETHFFTNSDSSIRINNTVYDLGITDVLRQLGTVYDEYVYNFKDNYARVIRRVGVDGQGNLYELPNEVITELTVPDFVLDNNDTNVIEILNYSANMQATYIIKNDYSDMFVTDVRLQGALDVTSREIKAEVSQEITTAKGEVEREISSLEVRADQIESTVQGHTENISTLTQTSTSILAKLHGKELTSEAIIGLINNRDGTSTALITASNINLTGFIKATDLSGNGTTTINGANIRTGTINSSRLDTSTINASNGHIAGWTITNDSLDSSTAGMSNGHYYAFYVKNGSTTPYYVTLSGDLACKTLLIDGFPTMKTSTIGGKQVIQYYVDGNQLVTTTENSIYIVVPDSISSDRDKKKNIKETDINGSEVIKQMDFVQFDWKGTEEHEEIGVIAQDVEHFCKYLVSDINLPDGTKSKVFNSSRMIFINAKAIKEVNKELDELKEENKKLKSTISDLILRIEKLEEEKANG